MAERVENIEFLPHADRTRLAEAVLARLEAERRVVVTPYDVFQALRPILSSGERGLYLRLETSPIDYLKRVTNNLIETKGVDTDPDYGRSVYRVLSLGQSSAEEVCALANPFGYVSHLSAMQHWGLTERRPEALHLTMPPANAARPVRP
jgi:hypothetical protein